MQKLYCYVDESGQDTKGQLFIVAVIIADEEREELQRRLEQVEKDSKKGRVKWRQAKTAHRISFWSRAMEHLNLQGKCFVSVFRDDNRPYLDLTVLTTAQAIQRRLREAYRATIFVDGLGAVECSRFSKGLRRLRVKVEKVRGMREQSNALLRFADALAGFAREYMERKPDYVALYRGAVERGVITEL